MFTKFLNWIFKPFDCKVGNHALVLSTEDPMILRLVCKDCPYESPGWVIKTSNKPRQVRIARFR